MLNRLPRRSVRLASATVLLAATLSACGFNPATDRVNTISHGVNDRDMDVDILGALFVSSVSGQGTFQGNLVNNTDTDNALSSITLGEGEGAEEILEDQVDIPAKEGVNLEETALKATSPELIAGRFITVNLTFDNGDQATMDVPVMAACYEFEGLDKPDDSEQASADSDLSADDPEALDNATGNQAAMELGVPVECEPESGGGH